MKQTTAKAPAPPKKTTAYNAEALTVLEGLRPVRVRPGMYIGDTDSKGMHHLLWEIIDNAIDEAANGYADLIEVTVHEDGSLSVSDNGRGMPVDIHPEKKVPGVELIFTQLHAGGKFDSNSYRISGGLHGVGAAVVNALSEWLTVEVRRGGKCYREEFYSYEDEDGTVVPGAIKKKLRCTGKAEGQGSTVHYKPDKRVFSTCKPDGHLIAQKMRELAFLNAGIKMVYTDLRKPLEEQVQTFCYKDGLSDFIRYNNSGKTTAYKDPIILEGENDGIWTQVAIQHTDAYSESIVSYVNNIRTTEGGTHETGFKLAVTKVFNAAAREMGVLKDKDDNFLGEDFREGISAIVLVKMRDAQFEGQTKSKLGNISVKAAVETVVTEQLDRFVQNIRHESIVKTILEKAKAARSVREATKKANTIARQKNSLEVSSLVGKFASSTGRDATVNEMYIVEGDSAGGSAKQARDRRFQAILPLRGKPLNSEKRRLEQILDNEEIRSIITALGTGIGADFKLENLKYHKVVILADADQDGAHIRALLLTFFYRYMRPLITEGHVYIGMPPLYRIEKKGSKEVRYAYSDEGCDKETQALGGSGKVTIMRYKGLGEMNPALLWETTMNPANRTLIRVCIDDIADAERLVTVLMGDNSEVRREYIIENANFSKQDEFAKKVKLDA
ncbi:MAG: DNA gyrase subunit B [Clostridia bacterium]|nr:DNA gyrase subunit B [Clostridia bacterium]